jgi:hypothetical protein
MPEATISLLILLASIINNAWQKNWLLLKNFENNCEDENIL